MNVVILHDFAHVNGGSSQVAVTEAVALARAGANVIFFAAVGPVAPELAAHCKEVVTLGQQELAKERALGPAVIRGIWNFAASKRLARLLAQYSPADTIVHLHTWTKALSPSVVHTARKRGFRIVCTLHDYFTACPNGGFYDYRSNEICRLKPLSAACVLRNCDRRSYAEKLWRVARQSVSRTIAGIPGGIDGFLYSTDFSLRVLKPYLPAQAFLRQLKNPIDVPDLGPADPGSHESFTAVGRIVPEKGLELLAQAAHDIRAPVAFVGDGECRSHLLEAAPNATITGWMPRAEVLAHIRASRALVLPSRLYETQGMVVLEAASQGVPALVPDSSAARESVEDGITGFWFEGGNWQSLADRMRRLEDPETARRMGRAAYERFWRTPMSPAGHAAELIGAYRELLDRHAKP